MAHKQTDLGCNDITHKETMGCNLPSIGYDTKTTNIRYVESDKSKSNMIRERERERVKSNK
jgi:hypothetical protein